MHHNLREFLRHGGSGQYVFARQNGAVYGYRAGISIKSVFPGYAELRADFADQLDRVIADNSRMLLNALTPPDSVPWVTEAECGDVSVLGADGAMVAAHGGAEVEAGQAGQPLSVLNVQGLVQAVDLLQPGPGLGPGQGIHGRLQVRGRAGGQVDHPEADQGDA